MKPNRHQIGLNVSISPRGKKKIWNAEFWQDGQHRRRSLKTTNKDVVIERATKLSSDLTHGDYKSPPPPVLIRQAADDFLTHLRGGQRAPKTIVKYTGVLGLFREFLAGHRVTRLAQVTAGHFDRFRAERTETRRRKTVLCECTILKGFFRWAKSRRLIVDNPFADIRLTRPPMIPKAGPSLAEIDRILATAQGALGRMLTLLVCTGMRSGELQRLRQEDVDLAGNWMHIESRVGAETKTRKSRKIPIHARLRPIIEAQLEKGRGPWLFAAKPSKKYPVGGNWISTKRLNENFQTLLAELKLPAGRAQGFTTHSIRHFFETFTVNSGIPQRVIDTWLGHRSDQSMGSVYYRLLDEESQKFMKQVPLGTGTLAAGAGITEV